MSFFQDIFGNAKKILEGGKEVLKDQVSSEITYTRGQGITSDTGSKPKIVGTTKEFLFPTRGFTEQEIKEAEFNPKDSAIGIAKVGGEIVQGGINILSAIGRPVAKTILPGYEDNPEFRQEINQRVSEKLQPSNPSQAKTMRFADVAGVLPVGSVAKTTKLGTVGDIVNSRPGGIVVDTGRIAGDNKRVLAIDPNELINVLDNVDDVDRAKVDSMVAAINRGEDLGPITVQATKEGNITIKDGNYRALAAREAGELIDVIDETPVPKAKPPVETPAPRQNGTNFDVAKFDADAYVKQQVKERDLARKGDSFTTKLGKIKDEVENKLVDFTAPIENRYLDAVRKDPEFAATQVNKTNIRDRINRVLNAPSITNGFIKDNGLTEVIQGVDNLDEFDQFLIARHAQDVAANGIKTGRNLDADKALIEALGPKYQKYADQVTQYNEALLDYMVDSGLISADTKTLLRERYPNYVPLQRVFSENELGGGFSRGGVASLSKQSVIQKLVGSERKIDSPLESIMAQTNKAITQGEKNKAAREIIGYADIKDNPFELRRIKNTADAAADKGTITALVDGKKQIWEVNKDVADAAKQLDVERINILGQIFAAPVRLARLGITGINLPFVAANVARDQVSAFIMSNNGLRSSIANPRVWVAGMAEAVNHRKLYDEMISEGALMTSFDLGRNKVMPNVARVRSGKNALEKGKYVATNPSQLFRHIEDLVGRSEEPTRMQQYLGAKQAALNSGVPEAQARVIAARAARENSTNFARRGEWGTVLNSAFLYLNAGIQGSRLLVRNLRNKPVKTSAKIATALMMPMATATYWNLSDPKRKEAYEDIQDYEKENNIIIVPPNPTKDENGRWNVIKMPLPPGVGQFANHPRNFIERSYDLDEDGFMEAARTMLATFSPIDPEKPLSALTPQAIKPTIQAATNKNLFTGNPIVPQSMQDLPPEQQVKDNTSGTAEIVANAAGVSPIKTEQFVNDTLGGIGPQILNASDRALVEAGVLDESQIGGRSIPEGIARRFNSAAGNATEQEQLNEIYELKKQSRGESNARKELAEELYSTFASMPKEEANAELRKIYEEDRPLYDKIIDVKKDAELGLSSSERAIKQLGVSDGTRASYIYTKYKEIADTDPAAAKAYLQDLRQKKVISDRVLEQLKTLREEDNL